jgi:hypothetical protein
MEEKMDLTFASRGLKKRSVLGARKGTHRYAADEFGMIYLSKDLPLFKNGPPEKLRITWAIEKAA